MHVVSTVLRTPYHKWFFLARDGGIVQASRGDCLRCTCCVRGAIRHTTYSSPYYLGWPVITVSLHITYYGTSTAYGVHDPQPLTLLLAVLGEKEEIETGGQRTTMATSLPLRTPYWYCCFDQTGSSDHRGAQLQRLHPKMEYDVLRTTHGRLKDHSFTTVR